MISTKRAADVIEDDLVDLENDPYADPNGTNEIYPFEFARVIGAERETDTCVRVDFDAASIGFPLDHLLKVFVQISLHECKSTAMNDPA